VRAAQGRHREVLRRRRHPQAQAARQQKKGKKRLRQFGKVDIPQEAFIAALKVDV
jgi:translation elongation factor EF-4